MFKVLNHFENHLNHNSSVHSNSNLYRTNVFVLFNIWHDFHDFLACKLLFPIMNETNAFRIII